MVRQPDLSTAAREFAAKLKTLLNRTVCNGAHVGSLLAPEGWAAVGTNADRNLDTRPVRLRSPKQGVYCWLDVSYRMYLDGRGYLTAHSSTYALHVGPNAEHELFHYDYERDKDAYTEAHLQVSGESHALSQLMASLGRPRRTLQHLHFPVGGRRFRPSLEDVLECLVNEKIAAPVDGWQEVLNASREEFREKQLRAIIARRPDIAVAALREAGYEVTERESQGSNVIDLLRGRAGRRSRRKP